MLKFIRANFIDFKVPKLTHSAQCFSAALMLGLCLQILSGVSIAIHYEPSTPLAFHCLDRMARSYKFGWLLRSFHHVGASLLFAVMYAHLFKNIYCRSYSFGREGTWIIGTLSFILIMVTGFLGSVLPWGQISYWAGVVSSNFVEVIPCIGKLLKVILLGGPTISDGTLKRFFVFHCILPFVVITLVASHVWLVHAKGQLYYSKCKLPVKRVYVSLHLAYINKAIRACLCYLLLLFTFCTLAPDVFSNKMNYYPANYLVTPLNVKPEWYFMPFFAMLKTFESKTTGVMCVLSSFCFLLILPFVYKTVPFWQSIKTYRITTIVVSACFVCLAMLGELNRTSWTVLASKVCIWLFWSFCLWPLSIPLIKIVGDLSLKVINNFGGNVNKNF
ncbi:MAG: cytochrome b N-terminal domain-containing protein [Candidatus Hodgkinia cicadicola]